MSTHAPFSHHILLTHAQSSLTHDKPVVLTEALLQVNGLGVDFAGMERAALSTALTQVPEHPISCDHLATWLNGHLVTWTLGQEAYKIFQAESKL